MTSPMTVAAQDDEAVEVPDGCTITAPFLAAIQHSYEEATARIHGLAPSSGPAAPHGTDPHPGTESIDLRLVRQPAVLATTPPTAAMGSAARLLAEQPLGRAVGFPVVVGGPGRQRRTTGSPGEPEARGAGVAQAPPTAPPRRRRLVVAVISRCSTGSTASHRSPCRDA